MQAPLDDALDPEIRKFQIYLTEAYGRYPALDAVPVDQARYICEQVRAPLAAGGPRMASTLEFQYPLPGAKTVRLRVHVPYTGMRLPALVYLHGGGWTLFSIDTHDRLMREYAMRAGVVVVGINYALAPEVRFPVALQEIASVVESICTQAGVAGIPIAGLALGGDSAGANLALATALFLRAADKQNLVRALLLNYGAYGGPLDTASHRQYGGGGYVLDTAEVAAFWQNYLRDPADLVDPIARPLWADVHGLPPVFLCVGACDVLLDENQAMAQRMRDAGVDVACRIYPGATHSFLEAVSMATVANQALQDGADWLRSHLEI